MIYIASIGMALIMTFLLFFYMTKRGYFLIKDIGVHTTLVVDDFAVPDKAEKYTASKNKQNAEADEQKEKNEEMFLENIATSVYSLKQSFFITFIFFLLSVVVNYLLYSYLITMKVAANDMTQPFLFLKMSIMNGIIAAAALTDYKRKKIPNELIVFGLFVRLAVYITEYFLLDGSFMSLLKNDAIGFLIGFVMLFIVAVISRGGLGFGDVKLFGVAGLMIGSAGVFVLLFISLLINSITAIILIVLKKKTFHSALPMAPFIFAGYTVMCVLGMF